MIDEENNEILFNVETTPVCSGCGDDVYEKQSVISKAVYILDKETEEIIGIKIKLFCEKDCLMGDHPDSNLLVGKIQDGKKRF